jgi:hypothetical protein
VDPRGRGCHGRTGELHLCATTTGLHDRRSSKLARGGFPCAAAAPASSKCRYHTNKPPLTMCCHRALHAVEPPLAQASKWCCAHKMQIYVSVTRGRGDEKGHIGCARKIVASRRWRPSTCPSTGCGVGWTVGACRICCFFLDPSYIATPVTLPANNHPLVPTLTTPQIWQDWNCRIEQ